MVGGSWAGVMEELNFYLINRTSLKQWSVHTPGPKNSFVYRNGKMFGLAPETVSANKELLAETVPTNKELLAESVPTNKELLAKTVLVQ